MELSIFKAIKSRLSTITDKSNEDNNVNAGSLLSRITKAIGNHCERYDTTNNKPMSPQHKKMCSLGLIRIQRAIAGIMGREEIMNSFRVCGIQPFDFNTILKRCPTLSKVSSEQLLHINKMWNRMAEEFRNRGELTDQYMDSIGIPRLTEGDNSKDQFIPSRRRFCILTNPAFLAREAKRKSDKEAAEAAQAAKPKRTYKKRSAAAISSSSSSSSSSSGQSTTEQAPQLVLRLKCARK